MKIILAFILLLITTSCNQVNISSSNSMVALSDNNLYLSSQSKVRLYWLNNGLGTFVSELLPQEGKLVLPKSLQIGDYGIRLSDATAVSMDLIAKVYVNEAVVGDRYFESLVLSSLFEVTNVTTALSWYLRFGFSGNILISQKTFNNLVLNIELKCENCRKKTNSQVLDLILTQESLQQLIYQSLQKENPQENIAKFDQSRIQSFWGWSDPNLVLNGQSLKEVDELNSIIFNVFYMNPFQSTQLIYPQSWTHDFNSQTNVLNADRELKFDFTYDHNGSHKFTPQFRADLNAPLIFYDINVNDKNRAPLCDRPIVINMRANAFNSIDIKPFCRDLDFDETGLGFVLSSGPNGLSVTANGLVNWTPPNNITKSSVQLVVNDSKSAVTTESALINVNPDSEPVWTLIPTTLQTSEGVEAVFNFSARDLDGDPLELKVEPVGIIRSGYPDGAGLLNQIVRSGAAGDYDFEFKFTPSYLQTIAVDGKFKLKFFISYESMDGTYDSTIRFKETILEFDVSNLDDPPVWTLQPDEITATEGMNISSVLIGSVIDPNPNSTALTLNVNYIGEEECNWKSLTASIDGSGQVFLSGIPPYYADLNCRIIIVARDSNDLATDSASLLIVTTNVNRPITVIGSPTTSLTGDEGKLLSLDLSLMFSDPDLDLSPVDQRESITYSCMIDDNSDTVYDQTCASKNLNFNFSAVSYNATLTPPAFSEGTYKVSLTLTDVGGNSATHQFELIINPSPNPMILQILHSSNPISQLEVDENSNQPITLDLVAASGRPVDIYNFIVTAPTCSVVGGGNCRNNFMQLPGTMEGNGSTQLTFNIDANYEDGNAPFPTDQKKYIISFNVQKEDDSTVFSQISFEITVKNINRLPHAIELNKGSFGCAGSVANSDTSSFTICIDLSQNKKVGNTWSKTYQVNALGHDLDSEIDQFTYELVDTKTPGSFVGNTWTIRLPSCLNAASTSLTRSYPVKVNDGRGGSYEREVILKINKGAASASCM